MRHVNIVYYRTSFLAYRFTFLYSRPMLAVPKDICTTWKNKKDVRYCGSNLLFSGWLTGQSYPLDIELTNLTVDLSLKRQVNATLRMTGVITNSTANI